MILHLGYSPVLILVQLLDHALFYHDVQEFLVLFIRAIADVDALRLAQLGIGLDEIPGFRRQTLQIPLHNLGHDVHVGFQLWGHY